MPASVASIVSRDTPFDASAPATARRPLPRTFKWWSASSRAKQPDLLETVELRGHLGVLEPRVTQSRLELPPRPRPDGEQPQRAFVAVDRPFDGALGVHVM